MIKKFAASVAVALPLLLVAPVADAQSYNADGSNKATTGKSSRTVILAPNDTKGEQELILRQQQRMDLFDADLKDLRGSVEQGFRTLQMQIEQLSSSTSTDESEMSASIRSLQDNMERLTDALAMTNRRMERTLEITSDVEFRLLRMEKRMQTLMTLGGDDLANAAVADNTLPADYGEQITMKRNTGDGTTTWSVDDNKLNQQLGDDDTTIAAAPKNTSNDAFGGVTQPDAVVGAQVTAEVNATEEASAPPAKPKILPTRVQMNNTALPSAKRCRTIWKPRRELLPSSVYSTRDIAARLTPPSGLVESNSCGDPMRRQP